MQEQTGSANEGGKYRSRQEVQSQEGSAGAARSTKEGGKCRSKEVQGQEVQGKTGSAGAGRKCRGRQEVQEQEEQGQMSFRSTLNKRGWTCVAKYSRLPFSDGTIP